MSTSCPQVPKPPVSADAPCQSGLYSPDATAANNYCGYGCNNTADCATRPQCFNQASYFDQTQPEWVNCEDYPNYVCDGVFPPCFNAPEGSDMANLSKAKICQINAGINPYYACSQAIGATKRSPDMANMTIGGLATECQNYFKPTSN